MGKPYTVEDWELTPLKTEKFTKSFQDYLDTRLTLDEMMKQKPPLKEKKSPNSNVDPEHIRDPRAV
jgi:hypothetical protein